MKASLLLSLVGGVFDVGWTWWIETLMASDHRRRKNLPGPQTDEEEEAYWTKNADTFLRTLPLQDMPLLKDVAPYYYEWLRHPPDSSHWDFGEVRELAPTVKAAVLNLSGWYDDAYGPDSAIAGFLGARRGALVMGPWVHGAYETELNQAGSRTFAENAKIDYDAMVLGWLEHHLKGTGEPPVKGARVYVMGEDRWVEGDRWPLPGTTTRPIYLTSAGGLAWGAPSAGTSTIDSDPRRPVEDSPDAYGAYDHRFLEGKPGVLQFETPPLAEDLRVVGDIEATIWASSDAKDFDVFVRLIDVAPDGTAYNVTTAGQGVVRASRRGPRGAKEAVPVGKPFALTLPHLKTANTFKKGHKLRVIVTTSWATAFPVNLQTGASEHVSAETRRATVTFHHGGEHASRIELPLLK